MPGILGAVPFREAAKKMGVSVSALQRWIAAGVFTAIRRGPGRTSRLLIPAREIDAYRAGGIDAVQALRAATAKPKKRA